MLERLDVFRCVLMRTGPALSTEISVAATGISVDRAHMNTPARLTGMKIFQLRLNGRLAASVAAFWLICWIVHFKSRPFSWSSKVTRVDNSTTRGTIEISTRGAIFNLSAGASPSFSSRLTRLNFSYEHTGPARSTGLIWTGPKSLSITFWPCKAYCCCVVRSRVLSSEPLHNPFTPKFQKYIFPTF